MVIQEDNPKQVSTTGAASTAGPSQSAFYVWGAGTSTSSQWEPESMRVGTHFHYTTVRACTEAIIALGLYPAYRAARIDPIVPLRHE